MSGHPFRFEKAAKLDNEERRALQPAGPLVEQIATWAPERILDVGVGTGYFALPLARALPRAGIVGVDAEPRMLELARERAEGAGLAGRITLRQTPPDRLELEDAGFDLVLMANLYHELPERPGYLGEIRRVLRAGGRLVICDCQPTDGKPRTGPPNDHRVAPQVAEAELRQAGLDEIIRLELYPDFYTLVARRPGPFTTGGKG